MAGRSGIKAGRAFVLVEAVDATGSVLNRIGKRLREWGRMIERLGWDMFMKGGMLGAAILATLKGFKDFDDAMKRVQGRTLSTNQQMEELRTLARSVGKELGYTATEVANLMDELAQLGFNRQDIIGATKSTLELARSSGTGTEVDPRQAAELVGSILNSYELERTAENVAMIADLFALAANRGNFSLIEFTEAMKNAATVGKQFKLPLPELVAMASQLRDVSIASESVGIAIRNIFLRMSDQSITQKFNEELKALTGNTIAFTDGLGNLRSPAQVLFEIGEAVKDLGTQQQGALFDRLIGDKAIVAGMVLSQGVNKFRSMAGALRSAQGFAGKVSQIMQSGIGGAFRLFLWGVTELSIQIGEVLSPMLISLAHTIPDVLNRTNEWMHANKAVVISIFLLVNALVAGGIALMGIGLSTRLLGHALIALSPLFTIAALSVKIFTSTILACGTIIRMVTAGTYSLVLSIQMLPTTIRAAMRMFYALYIVLRTVTVAYLAFQAVLFTFKSIGTVVFAYQMLRAALGSMIEVVRYSALTLTYFSGRLLAMGVSASTLTTIMNRLSQAFFLLRRIDIFTSMSNLGPLLATTIYTQLIRISMAIYGLRATALWSSGAYLMLTGNIRQGLTYFMQGVMMMSRITFTSIMGVISQLSSSLRTLLSNPLALVTASLVALAAILYINRDTIFTYATKAAQSFGQFINHLFAGFTVWWEHIGGVAVSIFNTIIEAWGGVTDALEAGDTTLAWEIAVLGMKKVWYDFIGSIYYQWDLLKLMFSGSGSEFATYWSGVFQPAINLLNEIIDAWNYLWSTEGLLALFAPELLNDPNQEANNAFRRKENQRRIAEGRTDLLPYQGSQLDAIKAADEMDRQHVQEEFNKEVEALKKKLADKNYVDKEEYDSISQELEDKRKEAARLKEERNKGPSFEMPESAPMPEGIGGAFEGLIGPSSAKPIETLDALQMGSLEAAKAAYKNEQDNKTMEEKMMEMAAAIGRDIVKIVTATETVAKNVATA